MVYPQENSFLSNRVTLVWGEDPDKHTYDCTCKWCLRFLIPCRHVLAVAKGVSGITPLCLREIELTRWGKPLRQWGPCVRTGFVHHLIHHLRRASACPEPL